MSETLTAIAGLLVGFWIAALALRLWVTLGKISRWIDSSNDE